MYAYVVRSHLKFEFICELLPQIDGIKLPSLKTDPRMKFQHIQLDMI